MSSFASRYGDWLETTVAACDTLIVLRPAAATERHDQSVLMAAALGQPFVLSAAGWLVIPGAAGAGAAAAFSIACLAGAVLPAVMVSKNRFIALARGVMLGLLACQLAVVIALAGGLVSPMAALVALPLVLCWLWRRAHADVVAGWAASFAALGLTVAIGEGFDVSGAVSTWQWFLPTLVTALAFPSLLTPVTVAATPSAVSVLEASSNVAALSLTPDGEVTETGLQAAEWLGVDPGRLNGQGFFERIHVADRVGWLCAVADLRAGGGLRAVEFRLKVERPTNGPIGFLPFAAELSRSSSREAAIIVTLRDNSAAVRSRRALADADEKVERLEFAKAKFLASVSHELRTPLNSIIGFSDLILHEVAGPLPDPRQADYVRLVREAGDHLLGVVNSILDLSKIEAGTYRPELAKFSLRDTIELVCAMLKLQAEAKSLRIVPVIGAELSEMRTDRRALQQVLINLLSNAIKFSHTRGTITVSARLFGSRVHLAVTDTGIGIAEADLRRLGQPFMQIESDHTRCLEGTGLGLALVKGLVAMLSGTLSIESAVGDGTTVTVTLPVDGVAGKESDDRRVIALPVARNGEGRHGAFRKAG